MENTVRRNFRMLGIVILLAMTPSSWIYSQVPLTVPAAANALAATASSNPDVAAIQAEAIAFASTFNKRDAKAVAAFWTKDGEYIDDSGRVYVGREAIEGCYSELFKAHPESKLNLVTDAVRLLSGSAAIEDGRAMVEPAPAGTSGFSTYTAVHVKVDGKWLMASVRDTMSDSLSPSKDAADLEWLVGDWTAEEHGVKSVSICRWVAGDRFLERKYTTTQLDGTKTTGVQLIGWNPLQGHVQSWDFNPSGGHAVGVWYPTDGGWRAEVNGTSGDGVRTSSVNQLRRLDDNAYVWQSVQRSLGGVALPDTDEVVIRRSKSKSK